MLGNNSKQSGESRIVPYHCQVYGVIHFTSPAGWLPVHRDQPRAQRSVTSMGKLYLFYHIVSYQWREEVSWWSTWLSAAPSDVRRPGRQSRDAAWMPPSTSARHWSTRWTSSLMSHCPAGRPTSRHAAAHTDRAYTTQQSQAAAINTTQYDTIRHDTRCYFNVRSKADISQLNLPHWTDN